MKYQVEESLKARGKKHPDRDEWVGYRWPATRITEEQRQRLCIMSNQTKKPITQLIAEAVDLMCEVFRNE